MSEKITSSSSAKSSKDSGAPVRKKKPTLSQQVRAQAEKVEQLNTLLQQKNEELASLLEHVEVIDKLTATQAHDKERYMTTAAVQEELIDDLTNRLLEVDIELAATSLHNKHVTAINVVKNHILLGTSLGLIPAPLIDIAALTGTQFNMLRILCKHYDIEFNEQQGKALLTSLLSGSLPVMAVLGLSSVAKIIPGIGTIGGSISMSVLAGSTIYATGHVFIRHFDLGGTLENFDSKYWQVYFKQELEEGKLFVKSQLKNKSPQEFVQD